MKILFISKKNIAKPFSVDLKVFLIMLFITIFVAFYCLHYLLSSKAMNKIQTLNLETNLNSYQDNINLFVSQLGELNARILELDNQTERLYGILKKQLVGNQKLPSLPKKDTKTANQGGPFINSNVTEQDLQIAIQSSMELLQKREDIFNEVEAIMLKQSVLKDTLPTLYPVNVPYSTSSYGWRTDPLLGIRAFHEGLDFSAAEGEQIRATASGIVIDSGKAPDYGNYLKIKHGNGIETRYAHASKLFVKTGDIIQRDQIIALVGNSGRSTGPHLHYEIRLNDRSLDPRKYLKKN